MEPRIAVVVSTRDRAQLIRGMLSSLRITSFAATQAGRLPVSFTPSTFGHGR
jgi:hypothetical protein